MDWLDDDFFDPDDGKNKDIENYIESTLNKVDGDLKFEDVYNSGNSKTDKNNPQVSDQCGLNFGDISDYVIKDSFNQETPLKVVQNEMCSDVEISNSNLNLKEDHKIDLQVDYDQNMKVQEIINDIDNIKKVDEPQMCWSESDLDLEFIAPQVLNFDTVLNQENQIKAQDQLDETLISDEKEHDILENLPMDFDTSELKVQEISNFEPQIDVQMNSELDQERQIIPCLDVQTFAGKEKEINKINDIDVPLHDNLLKIQEAETMVESQKMDLCVSSSDDGEIKDLQKIDFDENEVKDAKKIEDFGQNELKDQEVQNIENDVETQEVQMDTQKIDFVENEMKDQEAQNIENEVKTQKVLNTEDPPKIGDFDESELKDQEAQNIKNELKTQELQNTKDTQKIDFHVNELKDQPQNMENEVKTQKVQNTEDAQKIRDFDENELKDQEVQNIENEVNSQEVQNTEDAQKIDFYENELKDQEVQNTGKFSEEISNNEEKDNFDENNLKAPEIEMNIDPPQKISDIEMCEIPISNSKENEIQKLDSSSPQDKENIQNLPSVENVQENTNEIEKMDTEIFEESKDLIEKSDIKTETIDETIVKTEVCSDDSECEDSFDNIQIKQEDIDNEIKAHFIKPGQSRSTATGLILSCIKCNILFDSKPKLFDHLNTHSNKVIYCDLDCQHAMNAQEHLLCHDNTPLFMSKNRRFFCWICGYRTKNSSNAVVHMRMHSGSKPFQCSLCDFKDRTQSGVKRHEKSHSLTENKKKKKREGYSCNECDFTCSRMNVLHNHVASHFNSDFEVQRLKKPKRMHRKYTCDECPYTGVSSKLLRRHKMKHLCVKPYSCDVCNYSTVDAYSLKLHRRKHTGEKPHFCTVCDYKCSRATTLKVHMRIHTGEKPYACIHCEYRSANNSGLKSHMMSHTGEKPYSCSSCDFKCSSSRSMKRHVATHKRKDSNLSCPICFFPGMTNLAFRRHMKTHEESPSTLVCPEFNCDFTTYSMNHLQKHLKTHENVGDFTCHICGLMCERAEYLNTHLQKSHLFQTEITLTPQKITYACEECNYKTTNQKEFQFHGLSHSNESQLIISLLKPEIKLEVQ